MVVGCGLVTAGVTPGVTGFVPCCDLSARGCRPRPGRRSWPDQELDHPALAAPDVSHHSPAESPSRTGTTSHPAKERTHDQSDRSTRRGRCRHRRRHPRPHPLRGRGRHRDRWCPRRDHRRGDSRRAMPSCVEFANNHATLRAWAIEGTSGHGAGLSRQLLETSEIVIELDRPKRAARRNGAKSDPLDAIRAAREAMTRPRLGTPRSRR